MAARFWETATKIVAVGRNYAAHAKELGNETPTKPFFFLKPRSSLITKGPIVRPPGCHELAHEVEIGIVIKCRTSRVSPEKAMDSVAGYTLALDMTARDIQDAAKKKGLPWTEAKGYDTFCPVGRFIDKSEIKDISNLEFWLKVDGVLKQQGNTNQMIFKCVTWNLLRR